MDDLRSLVLALQTLVPIVSFGKNKVDRSEVHTTD